MFRTLYRLGVMLASRLGLYRVRYTVYIAIVLRLLGLLKHRKNGIVVDLGCGDGSIARSVSRTSKLPVVAIDIRLRNKRTSDGVEYLLADARYLPLRSNSIDYIYALSVRAC